MQSVHTLITTLAVSVKKAGHRVRLVGSLLRFQVQVCLCFRFDD